MKNGLGPKPFWIPLWLGVELIDDESINWKLLLPFDISVVIAFTVAHK